MANLKARGRRPGNTGTREAILDAARQHFAEVGYPRATIRAIAAQAGVDPRMITHHFGSKQQLFVESVQLPYDPTVEFPRIFEGGIDDAGARLAAFVAQTLFSPTAIKVIVGIMRAAATEPEAAEQVRGMVTERLLAPFAEAVGADHPRVRASLIASQLLGMIWIRSVVELPTLNSLSQDAVADLLAPVFQHYLVVALPDSA